ncbi:MAG: RHS repeat-associated core domain-containing protein, partial [Gemmatimonadota bacterium]
MSFDTHRADIDPSSGLAAATYDVSGIRTVHSYDALGRLTLSMPETGQGAGTKITYWPATGVVPASVFLETVANGGAGSSLPPPAPPPPCSVGNDDEILADVTYSAVHVVEACETITSLANVSVQTGSTTTFRAGQSISFADGFSVESGATFTAEIDFDIFPPGPDPGPGTPGAYGSRYFVFDGLGRLARESRRMPGDTWAHRMTRYDARGHELFVSSWSPTAEAPYGTVFHQRDAFGRPTRIQAPDPRPEDVVINYTGTRVVKRFSAIATSLMEELFVSTEEIYDRFGRLWQIAEPSQANGDLTKTVYTRGASDRLLSVEMWEPGDVTPRQTRLFTYDPLGFLRWEQHPEIGNKKLDYGDYDARGNAGWGNARNSADGLRFVRDRAERIEDVWEQSGQQRLLKSSAYGVDNDLGQGDYRNGKLVSAVRNTYGSSASWSLGETYKYTGTGGRVSQRDLSVNGTPHFSQSATWHEFGRLATLEYPDCEPGAPCSGAGEPQNHVVSHSYDNESLTAVPGYASSISYHPSGMLAEIVHTNGVKDVWTADPYGLRRPARIEATPTSVRFFDTGPYAYDGSGNVWAMGDDTFTYDRVGRIVSATVGLQPFSYSYDAFGNRLDTETETLVINQSTNRYGANGDVEYDEWGRLTKWEKANSTSLFDYAELYEYDATGMVTRHESRSGQWTQQGGIPLDLAETFAYDASDDRLRHERRRPVAGSADHVEVTWRLRDFDGKVIREFKEVDTDVPPDGVADEWQWSKDTVWREGTLLAAEVAGEAFTRHYHTDHLGSLRLVTANGGEGIASFRLGPFGEEISSTGEEIRYTGHERDSLGMGNFGDLDYMHARFCSPVQGRFLTPDPKQRRSAAMRPQTWNRYAYARNNPMRFLDPNGLEEITFQLSTFINRATVLSPALPVGRIMRAAGGTKTFQQVTIETNRSIAGNNPIVRQSSFLGSS